MPNKEIPFQQDMFSGELVDNRSSKQKKRDREQHQPRPLEMFSQREMAQFGVKANPRIPISPKTRLELALEDPRTAEEKAADERRQIEERTYRLFPEEEAQIQPPSTATNAE